MNVKRSEGNKGASQTKIFEKTNGRTNRKAGRIMKDDVRKWTKTERGGLSDTAPPMFVRPCRSAGMAAFRFVATCSTVCRRRRRRRRAEGFSDSWRERKKPALIALRTTLHADSKYCDNATGHTARMNAHISAHPPLRQMTGEQRANACLACLQYEHDRQGVFPGKVKLRSAQLPSKARSRPMQMRAHNTHLC